MDIINNIKKMEWIEITKDNRYDLKVGDTVKYHNGDNWVETELTDFEIDYGRIRTNKHNKEIPLVHSKSSEFVYVLR